MTEQDDGREHVDRVRSFEHQGASMVLVDFTGSSPREVLAIIDSATPLIRIPVAQVRRNDHQS